MSNPFETQTPEQIREFRAEANLTREQCAEIVGTKLNTWKGWELGRRKAPAGVLKTLALHIWALQDAEGERQLAAEEEAKRTELVRLRLALHPVTVAPKPTAVDDFHARMDARREAGLPYDDGIDAMRANYLARQTRTPEEEAESARDLANGYEYNEAEVKAAIALFHKEQGELIEKANLRLEQQAKRNREILAQD